MGNRYILQVNVLYSGSERDGLYMTGIVTLKGGSLTSCTDIIEKYLGCRIRPYFPRYITLWGCIDLRVTYLLESSVGLYRFKSHISTRVICGVV